MRDRESEPTQTRHTSIVAIILYSSIGYSSVYYSSVVLFFFFFSRKQPIYAFELGPFFEENTKPQRVNQHVILAEQHNN